jgi:hypothetical protein
VLFTPFRFQFCDGSVLFQCIDSRIKSIFDGRVFFAEIKGKCNRVWRLSLIEIITGNCKLGAVGCLNVVGSSGEIL